MFKCTQLARGVTCILFLAATLPAIAEEPGAYELINMIPPIDTEDPTCRSIDFCLHDRGNEENPAQLVIRAVYRAPNQFALLIGDDRDGTPIMFATDKRGLVYDPTGPTLMYLPSARSLAAMPSAENTYIFQVVFGANKFSRFRFDLGAVLRAGVGPQVTSSTAGAFRVESTTLRRNRMVATIEPDRPSHCTRLEVFAPNQQEPVGWSTIVVNGDVDDREFVLPDKRALAERLKVREFSNNCFGKLSAIAFLYRALYVRLGATDARFRDRVSEVVDWDAVAENDRKIAPILRELLGSPATAAKPTNPN